MVYLCFIGIIIIISSILGSFLWYRNDKNCLRLSLSSCSKEDLLWLKDVIDDCLNEGEG